MEAILACKYSVSNAFIIIILLFIVFFFLQGGGEEKRMKFIIFHMWCVLLEYMSIIGIYNVDLLFVFYPLLLYHHQRGCFIIFITYITYTLALNISDNIVMFFGSFNINITAFKAGRITVKGDKKYNCTCPHKI